VIFYGSLKEVVMKKIVLILLFMSLFGCIAVSFNQPSQGNRYGSARY
jgi:hypothetical protein